MFTEYKKKSISTVMSIKKIMMVLRDIIDTFLPGLAGDGCLEEL
ncbi:MAG: hypothetical protein WCI64_05450 [Chlorobium sp.]